MAHIGRFAPTPSGPLHFGSLVAAVASYCQARAQQGLWLMRIEDVDTPRVVKGSADQILADLEAFGFEWDGEVVYQSNQFERYRHYLELLLERGDCYACECSRRTLREQAVSSGPLGQIYPGFCRHKGLAVAGRSIRLDTENADVIEFTDQVYGGCELNLPETVGDFVLKRVDNIYAYHLAVVVDDYLHQIDEIVRGADLLENTCLHIYLQRLLGFPQPEYLHIPLVDNDQGVKLSKQTGATALDSENASALLLAALQHLGQNPQRDLEQASPADILHWAINHWRSESIPTELPATAEKLEG